MSTVTSAIKTIILAIQKKDDGDSKICLDPFLKILTSNLVSTSYIVFLENDSDVSYLRFATQLFSKVVNIGFPCVNIIIPHVSVDEFSTVAPHSIISPITLSNEDHIEYDTSIDVGNEGYTFGDSSTDFYNKYNVVAVGGTFDRLHAGHRLLLTAAVWAAKQKLRIGITGDILLQKKKHKELIADFEIRSKAAVDYAKSVKPQLPSIVITELLEAAGPTITDPDIDALVVSKETVDGGKKINETRILSGLKPLSLVVVDVLDTSMEKLSSSTLREKEFENKRACN